MLDTGTPVILAIRSVVSPLRIVYVFCCATDALAISKQAHKALVPLIKTYLLWCPENKATRRPHNPDNSETVPK